MPSSLNWLASFFPLSIPSLFLFPQPKSASFAVLFTSNFAPFLPTQPPACPCHASPCSQPYSGSSASSSRKLVSPWWSLQRCLTLTALLPCGHHYSCAWTRLVTMLTAPEHSRHSCCPLCLHRPSFSLVSVLWNFLPALLPLSCFLLPWYFSL